VDKILVDNSIVDMLITMHKNKYNSQLKIAINTREKSLIHSLEKEL